MHRCVRGVFQSVHRRSDVPARSGRQACHSSTHVDVVSRPRAGTAEAAAEVRCSLHDRHPRHRFVESMTLLHCECYWQYDMFSIIRHGVLTFFVVFRFSPNF